jgi:hypothetical protein
VARIRDFSSSDEFPTPARLIDSDAPEAMRHELIDLIFGIAERNSPRLRDERMHRIICQSLGERASGQPYGGFRYAAARDLLKAEWKRVYDLICRLWPEFYHAGVHDEYREGINRILAGYGVAWELDENGQLKRHLPQPVQALVVSAIAALGTPRFSAARALFDSAVEAFDDRPRRDRDACSNVFDGMESVAKEVFNMPNATFGSVLAQVRRNNALNGEVISILESVNTLRNRNFGHGMTVPFDLTSKEVEFVYLTCIGAILLFVHI